MRRPIEPNSSAVLRVCRSEICDVRGSARFSFSSSLLCSWRPATKSCPLQAASSLSLQRKVSVFLGGFIPAAWLLSAWFVGFFSALIGSMCRRHICTVLFHPAGQFQSDLSIVHPVKTTADGGFISHSVSHRFKGGSFRHDLQPAGLEDQVYYKVSYKGRSLTFNLTVNHHLVSSNYILERRNGVANRTEHPISEGNSCHLVGTVETSDVQGTAAVSTCRGLVRGLELCTTTRQKLKGKFVSFQSSPCILS